MKKIMLFAAACAALAACNKEIDTTTPEIRDAVSFEKGQQVCLTANAPAATKVTGSLNAKTDAVDFKWETGDKIKVIVGESSAEFTLSSGAGTATATFTGTMPAGGNSFNVQYPVTDPDLSSQTYVADGLPKDKMKMTATDCTLGNSFTLTPQNAALRLNLYGGAREVSQIVVTGSSSATYTLSLNAAVTVGKDKDNATPFFIVLPATESFVSAAVTANAIAATTENTPTYTAGTFSGAGIPISASTTFVPTEAQSLTTGSILNMPAVSLTTVWAPVNCGYDATNYSMGLLYQWGRKDGQGYDSNDATYPSGTNIATGPISDIQEASAEKFYTVTTYYNWYSGTSPVPDALWGASKTTYDPCPEGWRVPTQSELNALVGSHTEGTLQDGSGIYSGMKGKYFDGSSIAVPTSGLFLPAAGGRESYNGIAGSRGECGIYWSSSVDGDCARGLYFDSECAYVYNDGRGYGYSVRCVQE